MRFTFVHAADLHLDSPLHAAAPGQPALDSVLEAATFRAFERLVALCLQRRALFLLLAGDLFEAKDRSVRARLFLRKQLELLSRAGIQVFIVHGNHDPLSGDRGTVVLPEGVKVFGDRWEEACVRQEGQVVCRIQGISYATERVEENLSRRFARQGPEVTVGLLHANVGGQGAHANYAPASWEDLSAVGLDYWALGHVHTRAEQTLASGGRAVYPGNLQGRHANETGERGCMVVEVDGRVLTPRFEALDSVRWHKLRVSAEGIGDLGILEADIESALLEVCQGTPDAHVVRLTLEGRSALHRELANPEGQEGLLERLREGIRRRGLSLVVERLVDETLPLLDFDRVKAEGGLSAQVLLQVDALEEARVLKETPIKGLEDALARAGVASLVPQLDALAQRAARRAVELLSEDT